MLLPVGTIYHGTAKHYWLGKVQVSYTFILAQWRENGNRTEPEQNQDRRSPMPEGRGLRAEGEGQPKGLYT